MREADLYKDKIEVSLDGRQIFYLFFGGAVIVGLVFVLGVMVGRRVEARGHVERARTTAAADPLAALDRLEGNGGLSFKGSLMGKEAPSDVEKAIAAKHEAKQEPPKAEPLKPVAVVEPKPEVKKEEKKPEVKKEEKPESKVEAKAEPKVEAKKDAPKVEEKKPEEKKLEEKKPEEKKLEEKKAEEKKAVAEVKAEKPKSEEPKEPKEEKKYTLQLSSFQDKAEAEAFLSSIKASGYSAYVTEASVSGKGTFYRVRMGTYKSLESANDAKAEFEKTSKKTASVMRL